MYTVIWLLELHTYVCALFGVCSKQEEPTLIGSLSGKNVVQLATGANYSAAVTEDGLLFTWGKGAYGRLGHGELAIYGWEGERGREGEKEVLGKC